jgi:hypothetical protein
LITSADKTGIVPRGTRAENGIIPKQSNLRTELSFPLLVPAPVQFDSKWLLYDFTLPLPIFGSSKVLDQNGGHGTQGLDGAFIEKTREL